MGLLAHPGRMGTRVITTSDSAKEDTDKSAPKMTKWRQIQTCQGKLMSPSPTLNAGSRGTHLCRAACMSCIQHRYPRAPQQGGRKGQGSPMPLDWPEATRLRRREADSPPLSASRYDARGTGIVHSWILLRLGGPSLAVFPGHWAVYYTSGADAVIKVAYGPPSALFPATFVGLSDECYRIMPMPLQLSSADATVQCDRT